MNELMLALQILTIGITSFIAVISFIFDNKRAKNESVKIITEFRHERWQALLTASKALGAAVKELEYSEDERAKTVLSSLTKTVSDINYVLTGTYDVDKDIIALAEKIHAAARNYHENKTDYAELKKLYETFFLEVSIYSETEWEILKDQARGKEAEFKNWYENYNRISERYKNDERRMK